MRSSDVFISYKSEEFAIAERVRKRIDEAGVSCWMAPASIPGGSSYASEIPQAIRNCKVFVLILSKLAQESKWVPRELDQAINANKVIMPFTIDDGELRSDFDFYLTNVQRYPAFQDLGAAMENMVRDICTVLGREYAEPASSQAEPVSSQPEDAAFQPTSAKKKNKPIPVREKTKTKPAKNTQASGKKKGSGKKIIAVAAVLLLVFMVVLAGSSLISPPKITIAGKKMDGTASYINLEDKTLTSEDLQTIGKMKNLKSIHLHSCKIQDSDLSVMMTPKLTILELSDCSLSREQIEQIPFESFKLVSLDLSGNKEFDSLDALSSQTSELRILNIGSTSVKDLSSIPSFGELETLIIDNLGIADLSPLSGMTGLTFLSADDNKLTSLEPLSAMDKLTTLHVNRNKLKSLEGIERMIEVTELEAAGNKLTDTKALENMTILNKINLSNNSIDDISQLKKSEKTLNMVFLAHNKLKNLDSLGNGPQIHALTAEDNQITDIGAMKSFTNLTTCCLRNNQIEDAGPLEKLPACMYLDLSGNRISKIDFSKMSALHMVKLTGNPLTDWKAPDHEIRYLGLAGTKKSPEDSLYRLNSNYLTIPYSESLDPAIFKEGFLAVYIVDCPLDQQLSWKDAAPGILLYITKDQVEETDNTYIDKSIYLEEGN